MSKVFDFFSRFMPAYKQGVTTFAPSASAPSPSVGMDAEATAGNEQVSLYEGLNKLIPQFDLQMIEYIQRLVHDDPEVSQAVTNMVLLGNTDFSWEVGGVPSVVQEEIKQILNTELSRWYPLTDNAYDQKTFTASLLTQVFTSGATALEGEIWQQGGSYQFRSLHMIPVPSLRIYRDNQSGGYQIYQKQKSKMTEVALNPATFIYRPLFHLPGSYYPVVPLLSGLQAIRVERRLFSKMETMIDKLPLNGVIELLIKDPPARHSGETDSQYKKRTQTMLNNVTKHVRQAFEKNGVIVGWKGRHEFRHSNVTQNTDGLKIIKEILDRKKYIGVKQNPLLMHVNETTTESMASVILQLQNNLIKTMQAHVGDTLGIFAQKALAFQGIHYPMLTVRGKFAEPFPENEQKQADTDLKRANAFAKNTDTLLKLYEAGLVNRDDLLNRLDIQQGKTASTLSANPRPTAELSQGDCESGCDHPPADVPVGEFPYAFGQTIESLSFYEVSEFDRFKDAYEKLDKQFKKYFGKVRTHYRRALKKLSESVGDALYDLATDADASAVERAVWKAITDHWTALFRKDLSNITAQAIKDAYEAFRNDKNIFEGITGVPDAIFNTDDRRTMAFFRESDQFYLGKFITDKDTKRAINKFIRREYLERGTPLRDIRGFQKRFGQVLEGKTWKVHQIINTTLNQMRNDASLLYMQQVKVTTFEIRGIRDRLQCNHCKFMQGKQFSVTKQVAHVRKRNALSPEDVPKQYKFMTTIPLDKLQAMPVSEMEDRGIAKPSYHPNCRDLVIPVLQKKTNSQLV